MILSAGAAALAGATDVYGVTRLHDLYASFMSGNTTSLGIAIGTGDWHRAGMIGGLVLLFVAGAIGGAALAEVTGARHAAAVLAAVSVTLALPLAWPVLTIGAFVVAMGALNASMNHLGSASIGLTYVTGALVKLGQGLGRAICGKPGDWSWLWQLPMWLSLLAGAAAASLVRQPLQQAVWPLPAFALVLTIGEWVHLASSQVAETPDE